ncbi:MAG: hypothetical protein IPH68_11575 [Chitinophagaceae bacterium]|nr:hypothetical protein [Chitinophagaceae bacterium]
MTGISLASVIVILNSPLTAYVNPDSIRRMEIICQVPETNEPMVYREYNRQGLNEAFRVIKEEVGLGNFFRNGFKKLGYFFFDRSFFKAKQVISVCSVICYILFIVDFYWHIFYLR